MSAVSKNDCDYDSGLKLLIFAFNPSILKFLTTSIVLTGTQYHFLNCFILMTKFYDHRSVLSLILILVACFPRSFPSYEVSTNSSVIKGRGKSIYILDNGVKHHIPDWTTYISLGFTTENIAVVPESILETYPLGDPGNFMFH